MKFFTKPAAFFLIVVIMGLLASCDIAAANTLVWHEA
jgi:hypothetical protein